jgi:hypothetical protein
VSKDEKFIEYTKRSKSEQVNGPQEKWAKIKNWSDPVGGPGAPKDVVKPSPVGTGLNKPSDSVA